MTIELYFSNRLEPLAARFADGLSAEKRDAVDVLEAPVVIVPNANLAKWLKLFLADETGVCMNMGFRYLEDGLWEMLTTLGGGKHPPDRMEDDHRVLLLLHVLEHLQRDDPDVAPVAHYLLEDSGRPRPDYPARLWQLSRRLTTLFQEYEFHRTDMVRRWSTPEAAAQGMERCQQQLYLQVKALADNTQQRTGKRLVSLMDYAEEVLSDPRPIAVPVGRPPCIHFFGLSQISVFHLQLLGRLQPYWDIHVYALNPSREFWEDVQTPREKRWIRRSRVRSLAIREAERERGELLCEEDNPLLAAWGKPGRESVRLLCELTGYDFNSCFQAPDPDAGVLQRVQSDILTRSSSEREGGDRLDQDRSIQIAACPSRLREVETLYNSILFNLEQDESLQLNDIAVLVPDISAYKPLVDTVFQRKPAQLSYNLVDSQAEIESVYGSGVLSILSLAIGRFSRSDVFELLLNPCFMSRWNIEPDTVHVWAEWTEALNIFHSFDRADKRSRGYADSDSYTWKLGLQRLRLSRIMASPRVVDPQGFAHYRGRVPYGDVNTGDRDLLERFCSIIEMLHRSAEKLREPGAGGRQWGKRFFQVCDRLLEVPNDRQGESAVRQALVAAFHRLEFFDDLQGARPPSDLDLEWIREFVRASLQGISGGHGDYLTGGVTVSALRPMRPIPFRIVYVLGMEEGSFPGKAGRSSLDLRLVRRRIGDILLPEQNAYLFLEVLLSVRDRMYISYVSRDLQKDQSRQPCVLINQLKRFVEEGILPKGRPFQVAEVPLAGSSERYGDPAAVNDWSDVLVNRFLSDRLAWFRIHGRWDAVRRMVPPQELERATRMVPDPVPATFGHGEPAGMERVENITAGQLRNFLVHPVREKVRRHLGLFDEEETIEDVALREDEPFFSEFPTDYRLKMTAIRLWMERQFQGGKPATPPPDPGAVVQPVYDGFLRTGHTPEGAFAEIDRSVLADQVARHLEVLQPVVDRMRSAKRLFRSVVFGQPGGEPPAQGNVPPVYRMPPLSMKVPHLDASGRSAPREVTLHGQWPWLWQDQAEAWHSLVLSGAGTSQRIPEKTVIEPVLCYMMGLAGEVSGTRPGPSGVTLHIAYREELRTLTYAFDSPTARSYLQELLADYLTASRSGWLPFETVASLPSAPNRVSGAAAEPLVRDWFAAELEEALAEEGDLLVWLVRPSIPTDAFDRAHRRFRPFFQRRES